MAVSQELGDKASIAKAFLQIGIVAQAKGDHAEALRLYGESMKLEQQLGDKRGIAGTLYQIGTLAQQQGDYPEALRLYRESLDLRKQLGDKSGIAITLGQMGKLAHAQKRLKEALGFFLKAYAIFEELRSPNRELVQKDIATIREQAGEEQFAAWMSELSTDAEQINELPGEEKQQIKEQRNQ